MGEEPRYLLVESSALPEVFLRVVEAKQILLSGRAKSINEAARIAGVSRSAYYKYKDSIFPFNEHVGGRILTLHTMLRDEAGILSKLTNALYHAGANIMTVNQNIPVNGLAPVTVTARADGMSLTVEELLGQLRTLDGIESLEVVTGL